MESAIILANEVEEEGSYISWSSDGVASSVARVMYAGIICSANRHGFVLDVKTVAETINQKGCV